MAVGIPYGQCPGRLFKHVLECGSVGSKWALAGDTPEYSEELWRNMPKIIRTH